MVIEFCVLREFHSDNIFYECQSLWSMDRCDFVVIGFLVLLPRASKCFKKLACPGVGLLFLLSSSSSNSCSETVWYPHNGNLYFLSSQ